MPERMCLGTVSGGKKSRTSKTSKEKIRNILELSAEDERGSCRAGGTAPLATNTAMNRKGRVGDKKKWRERIRVRVKNDPRPSSLEMLGVNRVELLRAGGPQTRRARSSIILGEKEKKKDLG